MARPETGVGLRHLCLLVLAAQGALPLDVAASGRVEVGLGQVMSPSL